MFLHPFSFFDIVFFHDLIALVDRFPVPHPSALFIGQSVRLARKSAPFGRNPWRLFAIAHFDTPSKRSCCPLLFFTFFNISKSPNFTIIVSYIFGWFVLAYSRFVKSPWAIGTGRGRRTLRLLQIHLRCNGFGLDLFQGRLQLLNGRIF